MIKNRNLQYKQTTMRLLNLIFGKKELKYLSESDIEQSISEFNSKYEKTKNIFLKVLKNRKVYILRDQSLLLCILFFFGLVAFNSLIQVNLGTAFRHRSVLLVPLIFIVIRLGQLGKHYCSSTNKLNQV